MDRATAREPNCESLIVGVTECDDAARVVFQTLEGLVNNRTLHAAAAHRSRDIAVFVHCHRCARQTGS